MFSHVFVGVRDFERALAFYRPLLASLGIAERFCEPSRPWAGWQIAGQARATILLGLAAVLFGALARILGIGQRAHETVAEAVPLGDQRLDVRGSLSRFGQGVGEVLVQRASVRVLVRHVLSFPAGNHPADELRGIIDDRHDTPVIQPRRADHAYRTDNFAVRIHIG